MNEKQYIQYMRLLKAEVASIVCIRNEEYAEKWSRCNTVEDYREVTLYGEFWKLAYECGDINIIVQLVNEIYSDIYNNMIEREHTDIIEFTDAVMEEALHYQEEEAFDEFVKSDGEKNERGS